MHSSSRAGGRRWSGVVRDSPTYVGLMPVTLQTVLPLCGIAPMTDVAPVWQLEITAF